MQGRLLQGLLFGVAAAVLGMLAGTVPGILRFEENTGLGALFQLRGPRDAPAEVVFSILVDAESQKPIVVGKGGEMIKRIGTEARHELETMLDGRVYLELHVKVRSDWRDDERLLDEMGLRGR